jgi:hypothetical protein
MTASTVAHPRNLHIRYAFAGPLFVVMRQVAP